MILHSDRFFEHQYDVKLDLLLVYWPNIENIFLPEILHSTGKLVENIRNYNIRNLLIDASRTTLLSSYHDADQVINLLVKGLDKSNLEKLARIESSNSHREETLKAFAIHMNEIFSYTTRFFNDKAGAMDWFSNGPARTGENALHF